MKEDEALLSQKIKEELGDDWTRPDLFRIGASSLLGDIERQLFHFVTGRFVTIFILCLI